jgi:hypothetical protein
MSIYIVFRYSPPRRTAKPTAAVRMRLRFADGYAGRPLGEPDVFASAASGK